ncbi:MAG: 3-deoxy-manno-octulosonate cytidylyltransferase [Candidatus Comchoanobacterales bacterium]
MKNVIISIPARLDSTRFPSKLCAKINQVPIIQLVFDVANKCGADVTVIADHHMHEFCQSLGLSSVCVDGDYSSGTDRIASWVNSHNVSDDVLVVNVQGDEPAINSKNITHLIESMIASPEANIGTLYHSSLQSINDPSKVKVVCNHMGYALYFSRSLIPYCVNQSSPVIYKYHIGIYAYRAKWLKQWPSLVQADLSSVESLEQLKILESGQNIHMFEAVCEHYHGVDTPEDLQSLQNSWQEWWPYDSLVT